MALLHDGVDLTADLLREGMESSARTVKLVNRTVRVVTDVGLDLVERVAGQQADAAHAADPALPPAVAMRSDVMKTSRWASDAALGLVNAVVGDHAPPWQRTRFRDELSDR